MDLHLLGDAEILSTLCGIETATRQLGHAVHQLLVAIEERSIPAARGHKTVKKLLIELLRISSADAGARVAAAKDLGTWHTLTGQDLPVTLPDTAAAQRDGEIGADHARTIRNVIRKIPDAVPARGAGTGRNHPGPPRDHRHPRRRRPRRGPDPGPPRPRRHPARRA